MKIATFNINSVRLRQSDLIEWMEKEAIDIAALQETKVQDKDFPLAGFAAAGYQAVYIGEKGRNGVAIISKEKAGQVTFGLDGVGEKGEARLIKAQFGGIAVINTYVPQGRAPGTDYFRYKIAWLRGMRQYLEKHFTPAQQVIWLGDLNVAMEAIDVYDPVKLTGEVGFHPDEQAALAYSKDWGFVDLFRKHVPEAGHYTFWDYRIANALERGIGWRIDYILATPPLAERSTGSCVAAGLRRKERPSDHAPLVAEFDL
ncbi:MAG: exodeoxyribonuclease III [Acidaminococcales bacterium]|nr:exodeoxyribonuclease III [Acidaminococcales bacterium]